MKTLEERVAALEEANKSTLDILYKFLDAMGGDNNKENKEIKI